MILSRSSRSGNVWRLTLPREGFGSCATAAFSSHASRVGDSLFKLPVDVRLAMEMAANEESERFALEGEMALLEMAWEEAEEIAAIADNLTLPQNIERQLEELRRARNHDDPQP